MDFCHHPGDGMSEPKSRKGGWPLASTGAAIAYKQKCYIFSIILRGLRYGATGCDPTTAKDVGKPKAWAARSAAARCPLSGNFKDETGDVFQNSFQNVSRNFGHSRRRQKMAALGTRLAFL
jgi:hypothetical protein